MVLKLGHWLHSGRCTYKVANYKGVPLSASTSPSSGHFYFTTVAMLWRNMLWGKTTVFMCCCDTELSDCKHEATADLHYMDHSK